MEGANPYRMYHHPSTGNPSSDTPPSSGVGDPYSRYAAADHDDLSMQLARLSLQRSTPQRTPNHHHHHHYQPYQYFDNHNFDALFNLYNPTPLPLPFPLIGNVGNVNGNGGGDALGYNSRRFNGVNYRSINGGERLNNYPLQQRNYNSSYSSSRGGSEEDYGYYYSSSPSPRRTGSVNYHLPQAAYELGGFGRRSMARASSLEEMRGRIASVAKDQQGCRFLQAKFEGGNPQDIHMIFTEIKDHICELMVHQFGNYLVQKLLDVCNYEQTTQLLFLVIADEIKFANICNDVHGTRAVQSLLEHLTTQDQRCRMLSVLLRVTVSLTKNMNGHHVIQHCLKFLSIEDNKHILNVVADNCFDIATDKSGCCVLQQCLEHALGEPRQRLIAGLTSNALILSQNPFGNYVVQYILGLRIGHATAEILRELSGNFVSLCMDKYGSNVVEKCLKETDENQKIPIVNEIIYSPNFLRLLQDPYGNYVAQSALENCKGGLLHAVIDMINRNAPNLHSHPHGKRVLEKTIKGNKPIMFMPTT